MPQVAGAAPRASRDPATPQCRRHGLPQRSRAFTSSPTQTRATSPPRRGEFRLAGYGRSSCAPCALPACFLTRPLAPMSQEDDTSVTGSSERIRCPEKCKRVSSAADL